MHRSVSVKSDGCQCKTGSVKMFHYKHLIELYTLTDQGEEQGHSGSIQQYQCNSGPGPDGIKNISTVQHFWDGMIAPRLCLIVQHFIFFSLLKRKFVADF